MEEPNELVLLRYLNETADAAETAWVLSWLDRHPDNQATLAKLAYAYHAHTTRTNIANRDAPRALKAVYRRIRRSARIRTLQRVAAAACLLIGLVGAGLFFYAQQTPPPTWVTIRATEKLKSAFVLPDGSRVTLNAGSSLSYPNAYRGKERDVKLHGEAYFSVAHDADKPFIVRVNDDTLKIKVLGTEFAVSAFGNGQPIETTLVSGSVQLEIGGENVQVLKPAEKATYHPQTHKLLIQRTDTEVATEWMHNRLVFRETPMADVLARLVRHYGVAFDVKDEAIYGYRFTGVFEDRPLHHVLDYMRIASRITYTITPETVDTNARTVVVLRRLR